MSRTFKIPIDKQFNKNKIKRLCPVGTSCFICQKRQGITVKEVKEHLEKLKEGLYKMENIEYYEELDGTCWIQNLDRKEKLQIPKWLNETLEELNVAYTEWLERH